MNSAEQLFNTLESFNQPDGSGQTAEQRQFVDAAQ